MLSYHERADERIAELGDLAPAEARAGAHRRRARRRPTRWPPGRRASARIGRLADARWARPTAAAFEPSPATCSATSATTVPS